MAELMKILLLENDQNDVDLVQILLHKELKEYTLEFEVTETKKEFVSLIKEFKPDIILSDFMLPQYNGFEAIDDVKKIDNSIPIIIVTGSLSEEDAAESIKHGGADYVVKQRIQRLPFAIRNAIKFKKEQAESNAKNLEIKLLKEQTGLQIKTCFHTIEKAPVSILITSELGIIEYVNAKFIETTGFSANEAIGKTAAILKSGNQTDSVYKEMWDTILVGKEWKGEFINKKKNGDLYWADVSISCIKDEKGKIIHFIGIQIDVTDEKQKRKELEIAKEHAEESDKLKSLFLANLSHEIRTPMNGVLGFADLLKDIELTFEERMRFVSIIEKSGQRMLSIINDLIDISKIEAGQMSISYEHVDLSKLGEELYDFFKFETDKKSLELIYLPAKPSCIIETDITKLNQILTNLIKNAIKFTKTGKIEFGFTTYEEEIKFFVRDTGIGIHPKLQHFIFDRFRQADLSAYKSEEGIGLGLSISKAFIEMLGGSIWVESMLGSGSTFHFSLPIKELSESDIEFGQIDAPIIIDDLTILIAEDDISNFILLEKILRNATNARILHAQNGEIAIEIVQKEPKIDIILMDIKMPIIDGIEASRIIKKIKPEIPIIIQSAFASTMIKEQAFEAGCNKIISKPIQKSKLLKAISECL